MTALIIAAAVLLLASAVASAILWRFGRERKHEDEEAMLDIQEHEGGAPW